MAEVTFDGGPLRSHDVRRLLDEADAGSWWFDGRDIFHKPPGTNLDQIIVPLGHVISDTYTSGAVNLSTVRLMALAHDLARAWLGKNECPFCLYDNDDRRALAHHMDGCSGRAGWLRS